MKMDRSWLQRNYLKSSLIYLALSLLVSYVLAPFIWLFLSSIKTKSEIYSVPLRYLPENPTWTNYIYVWTSKQIPFSKFFMNSLIVAMASTVLGVLIAVFAGYAFSRFRFTGRIHLMLTFLTTQMFPSILVIIPLYITFSYFNLLNTYQCLIITYMGTFSIPFSTWLLMGFFESIPIDLDESAMIDGCSRLGALFRVVLPLTAPGIAATAIFCFNSAWSELLFSLMFLTHTELRTLPAGLYMMISAFEVEWGIINAGGVLAAIPTVVFFMFLQKYLIQGLTAGAVKG